MVVVVGTERVGTKYFGLFHKFWDIKMFLIIIYKKVFKDFVKFVLSYAQFKHTLINNNAQ